MKSPSVSPAVEFLLDLVFPKHCQNCNCEGNYLCISCQTEIETPPEKCPVCAKLSLLGRAHESCQTKSKPLTGLLVAASYHLESVRKLIWHFKYSGVKEAGNTLADLLVDSLVEKELIDYFADSVVIPVPLHKSRQKLRGFNQAEYLAAVLADKLNLVFLPFLRKIKNTRSQVELEKAERLKNLQNAFAITSEQKLNAKKVLLVDDVSSTSATLQECARLIKRQGASEIWGLVVARN